jgi:hypothetical protein
MAGYEVELAFVLADDDWVEEADTSDAVLEREEWLFAELFTLSAERDVDF